MSIRSEARIAASQPSADDDGTLPANTPGKSDPRTARQLALGLRLTGTTYARILKRTGMGDHYPGEVLEVSTWRWREQLVSQGIISMLPGVKEAQIPKCAPCGRMWASEKLRDQCDHGKKLAAEAQKFHSL